MIFSSKMNQLTSAIFSQLSYKKDKLLSQGREIIDFSIGTPDIPPAPHIVDTIVEESKKIENYVYAINDSQELINSVKNWYSRRYKVNLEDDEILSLLGSQSGFAELSLSLVNSGDVVLTPDPGYPIFTIGPYLAGAKIVKMPLLKENNYLVDFDSIDEKTAKMAKLMVVSYPNNPTAASAPRDFYVKLVAFAKKYNIMVLHDNAYSELVFDGSEGGSFLSIPGAIDIGIEFNSLSKTYSIPGCRIAFAVGNKDIINQLKILKSHIDYGMFIPFQKAAIAALNGPQDYVGFVKETYRKRRDLLVEGLSKIGWHIDNTGGSMFVWAAIPSKYDSSLEFTFDLMEKTGVIVVPGSSFGERGEGFVRFALVQNEDSINKAIHNIEKSSILKNGRS
ncbi:aminotransferase class I/II-fold pyridoxal phosphate-dependent enzyme [Clostridium tyrobutyricum]|uniref:Aminotransferase n=1 Tax=Clostridium tyrobutyricum DIVETGP TaxID=1408889 RepID=W6N9V0_CLOTY|nr:aminotransferase class I/II-fold pyridoxal phosphate-dependent enzyme [Clostridium tyrobutyricum]AND83876.1 aspartate/tyrosine/aromatic aminotransferase [Clostridium tyrobutyricum]ANP68624.1 LL-diaminopimelate aminotransferase [Clostridium tyrobutyricum]MBR9648547.1 aminotransferase class I/II-fold pyridoxal phosphate-dependent enzyme [Clostridium tyrobutyricum]MBV4425093.1 aminotransferase class I/II-fold pyridoxal phosphate-dependent enzyme [Clostridium tyrobutyricum]MBV4427893.1 aminotra